MNDKLTRQTSAVLIGGFIAVHNPPDARILILVFFILLLVRCCFLWKPADFYGKIMRPEVLLLIFGIIVGYTYGLTADKALAEPVRIENIQLEGTLADWTINDIQARGVFVIRKVYKPAGFQGFIDKAEKEEISLQDVNSKLGKKYSLRVYADNNGAFQEGWDIVKPGDLIRFSGTLEHPKPPGTPGEFDFPLYNAVRGLSGSISARGEAFLLEEGKPGLPWLIRHKVRYVLDRYWVEQAGILEGILFGDSSRIASDTLDIYKAAGVMHVFAASGANVAFVILLAWGMFFFLPRGLRIFLSIGAIVLYAALCQGNPPILRATILCSAVLLGRLGQGRISSLRWLLFAALILFTINPLNLKDVSCQLSFAATWGMIVLASCLEKTSCVNRIPQILRQAVVLSLGAQIAALPVLVAVFHRVSLAGLITNIFMLFILGAVLQFGLIATILIPLPILSYVFFQVAFWLLQITDYILSLVAAVPLAYFWVLNPGKLFWLLWYSALGILLIGKDKVWFILRVQLRKIVRILNRVQTTASHEVRPGRNKMVTRLIYLTKYRSLPASRKYIIGCLLVLILLIAGASAGSDNKLEITFLDVGQGDCIIVETPKEKILVDAGPRSADFDSGQRIVVPYLMEQRIGFLDLAVITHEDGDHLGGIKYLLANIPARRVAVPEVGERLWNEAWQDGLPLNFAKSPEKLLRLRAGEQLNFPSGLNIEVLAPVTTISGTTADSNNNSLVLLFEYHGWKVLLTGDMEREEMQQIWDRGADWDADFIKIPHHGGKGSFESSWFDRTDPNAVFILVGRNNFGHPANEVVEYWQKREVPVYRTDTQGTLRLVIDKNQFKIIPGR